MPQDERQGTEKTNSELQHSEGAQFVSEPAHPAVLKPESTPKHLFR